MGQFFKFLFASCLGVIIATFVLFGIGSAMIGKLVADAEKPQSINPNSVLHISLDNVIPEKTNNLEMDPTDFKNDKILGLHEIVETIENAQSDDRIKGIFLEIDGIYAGFSTASSLQEALVEFKESGKFIVAYSKYYTQGAYYLATSADKIYLNPLGMIDFRGFSAQIPFFKEMLDNIGIKMQVFYAGKFKSATEPYRRTDMSPENRTQIREYLDAIYGVYLDGISQNRNISIPELKKIADEYKASSAEDALKYGLVDAVGYRDEALDMIRDQIGLDKGEKVHAISLRAYNKSNPPKTDYSKRNKVAVVYAEGTIIDGKSSPGSIGDNNYTKIIKRIRKDDRIKAVVLRVNSPGGSAMSSENIWRELNLLKETGKPLVVSMGDYAASGGYYIACNADSIYAQSNTLTGSIGVFSMIPSASKLMNDKIGISFDTVKTGKFSHGISPFYDITEEEGRILQARTNQMYETFLKRVADGRGMTRDEVHEIAQGRVWTGDKAKTLGLVDQVGDLDNAIAAAANMAELDEYRISEYPATKDPIMQILEEFLGEEDITKSRSNAMLKTQLGELYPYYEQVKTIQEFKGTQARLPFFVPFK
jgi:protease-4